MYVWMYVHVCALVQCHDGSMLSGCTCVMYSQLQLITLVYELLIINVNHVIVVLQSHAVRSR